MRARNARITIDYATGCKSVSFDIDRPEDIPEGELELTIKPYKPKRSLSANAYMWELVGKLADATGLSPDEIYRNAVRQTGISQLMVVNAKAVPTIEHVWSGYGLGWFTDKVDEDGDGSVIIRAYYGSSVYNRKQMAALVDYIKQDCEAMGIETMTPAQLAGLLDRWESKDVQRRTKHNAR